MYSKSLSNADDEHILNGHVALLLTCYCYDADHSVFHHALSSWLCLRHNFLEYYRRQHKMLKNLET